MDSLIQYLRSHGWARKGLSVLSIVLLLSAVGMLGYPLYTNMWSSQVQGRLDREIASDQIEKAYKARKIRDGEPLTRIRIPDLGVDTIVVEGITPSALKAGAGHYPDTPLPCEFGNVAIAGHRTTYGKPFANVDQLKPGAEIILETPVSSCVYAVSKDPFIVMPHDFSVVANQPTKKMLTLTTCHPKGSAARRLIVQAQLTKGQAEKA